MATVPPSMPNAKGPHPFLGPTLSIIAICVTVLWAYLQMRHWKEPDADYMAIAINIVVTTILWVILVWAIIATYRFRKSSAPTDRPIIKASIVTGILVVAVLGLLGAWYFASHTHNSNSHLEHATNKSTLLPTPAGGAVPLGSSSPPVNPPSVSSQDGTAAGQVTVQKGGTVSFGQKGGQTAGTILNTLEGPPADPVIHIEPEHAIIWSTRPGQTISRFLLTLSNTGSVDIGPPNVTEDYFVAEKGNTIVVKDLGGTPVVNEIPAIPHSKHCRLTVDFRERTALMRELMDGFHGPSIGGVRITVHFRRVVDGKEFSIVKWYAAFGPVLYGPEKKPEIPNIYPEDAEPTLIASANGFLLREVIAQSETIHWVPVIHSITQDANGQLIHTFH